MEAVGVEPTSSAFQADACPRQLCLRVLCVRGVGRPSALPPGSGRLAPLRLERHALDVEVLAPGRARLRVVAEQQAVARFSGVERPSRERGVMWSSVSSAGARFCPQYWQRKRSRTKMRRRFIDAVWRRRRTLT